MDITSNAPLRDPHEPVLPEGMKPSEVAHTEDHPEQGRQSEVPKKRRTLKEKLLGQENNPE